VRWRFNRAALSVGWLCGLAPFSVIRAMFGASSVVFCRLSCRSKHWIPSLVALGFGSGLARLFFIFPICAVKRCRVVEFRIQGQLVRTERRRPEGGSPYVNWEVQYLGGVQRVDVEETRAAEFIGLCGVPGVATGVIRRREWKSPGGGTQSRDAYELGSFKASKP
jgi:hypothetical protein